MIPTEIEYFNEPCLSVEQQKTVDNFIFLLNEKSIETIKDYIIGIHGNAYLQKTTRVFTN